jgi:hypothetical protein
MAHGVLAQRGMKTAFAADVSPHFPTTAFIGIPDFSAT